MSDVYFYVGGFVFGYFTCWLVGKAGNIIKNQRKTIFHGKVADDRHKEN